MKNLILKFASLNGAKFININDYLSSTSGEIANHTVNVNISVQNAKQTDLQTLKNCTDTDLLNISNVSNIAIDVLKISLAEMIDSATKNLSENKNDRSAQSQGQSEAYYNITPAVRLHLETLSIHIFGQTIKKKITVKGTYKTVNSSPKTLGKKAITKQLDLRTGKFRDYILGNADNLKISGETINIVR